jgi:hypothetical protein
LVAAGDECLGDRVHVRDDALAADVEKARIVGGEVGRHLGAHALEHQLDELRGGLLHPRRQLAHPAIQGQHDAILGPRDTGFAGFGKSVAPSC